MSRRVAIVYRPGVPRALAAFLLVLVVASAARGDDHATTAFLGSETTWREARLSLSTLHALWRAGREVHVEGSGKVVARVRERDVVRRYEVTIPAQRARALLRLAVEVDLLTLDPPQHPGILDEGTASLLLRNARGGLSFVSKQVTEPLPAWDRVAGALEDLGRAIEREHDPVGCDPLETDVFTREAWTLDRPVATTWSSGLVGRGVELTRPSDLAELRERLRDLPRRSTPEAPGREFWLTVTGVRGVPEKVRVGAGVVQIYGALHEDTRELEAWLRARMREAGVDPDG